MWREGEQKVRKRRKGMCARPKAGKKEFRNSFSNNFYLHSLPIFVHIPFSQQRKLGDTDERKKEKPERKERKKERKKEPILAHLK